LNEEYDVFAKTRYLTQAKDVLLVETPGHTYHHCSVLLNMDGVHILFAADICYSLEQLMEESFPGNNAGNKMAQHTYGIVKAFARKYPTVFIPSHDAGAAKRLKTLSVIA
jgi:glyoxylase-like metal-dependent hydrolase (beta-lactamase superfamily II)